MGSTEFAGKTRVTSFPVDQFDEVRKRLEKGIGPQSTVAHSIDGRMFVYESPFSGPLGVGSYVVIKTGMGAQLLGQVITEERAVMEGPEYGLGADGETGLYAIAKARASATLRDTVKIRYLEGIGVLLGRFDEDGFQSLQGQGEIFQDAQTSKAGSQFVKQYFASSVGKYTPLEVGKILDADDGVSVLVNPAGLTRHTFLCGQSGSGKTFALGVILEQLLLQTELRVLIIDPNSDFVHLDELLPLKSTNRTRTLKMADQEYDAVVERHSEVKNFLKIMRPGDRAGNPETALHVVFSDLTLDEQSAVLQLHPIEDRLEFYTYSSIREQLSQAGTNYSLTDVLDRVGNLHQPLEQRIKNLGILQWEIWCRDREPSLLDMLESDWRCMVLDVGVLSSPQQRSAITMAVLGHLWRQRHEGKTTLVVIDEAHNICPRIPSSRAEAEATEHVIRMAGEGRKFGLHLLLASQRPGKIHPNVLSEIDNLILMRMNSRSDLTYISEAFGQVPTSFIDRSASFALGEALLTGAIVPSPTFAKFEGRLTREGGSDRPKTWAEGSRAE